MADHNTSEGRAFCGGCATRHGIELGIFCGWMLPEGDHIPDLFERSHTMSMEDLRAVAVAANGHLLAKVQIKDVGKELAALKREYNAPARASERAAISCEMQVCRQRRAAARKHLLGERA